MWNLNSKRWHNYWNGIEISKNQRTRNRYLYIWMSRSKKNTCDKIMAKRTENKVIKRKAWENNNKSPLSKHKTMNNNTKISSNNSQYHLNVPIINHKIQLQSQSQRNMLIICTISLTIIAGWAMQLAMTQLLSKSRKKLIRWPSISLWSSVKNLVYSL